MPVEIRPDELDSFLTTLRKHGAVKFEGFGVSVLLGPQAQKAVAAAVPTVEVKPPVPAAPVPLTPTVADIEKLEAELFEGQS